MPASPDDKGDHPAVMEAARKSSKLGLVSGVYIPVCLNIMSILMFLRFGLILGQVGFLGILAIASNGEVKGGGAYYLISRSLGPEFGGSIGILFFLAQALNTAMNIVGLLDCIMLNVGSVFPQGYWTTYGLQTAALLLCTGMCLLGSATFSKASNLLLAILTIAVVSIPISAVFQVPFIDEAAGIEYTGISLNTFAENFLPSFDHRVYRGLSTFRDLFGILFPATSGIFAGASMSGDLKNPSQAIPRGSIWAMLTTFIVYFTVILSMACTISRDSFLANANIVSLTNLSAPIILAGECAVTVFSALMGIIGSAKLFQALAKDKLLPGLSIFGRGTKKSDEPILAILLTYAIAQVALLADLNQIATFISMGYQMTFFVMNLACFLLKIGSAPNFRPSFKFFNWQTAWLGSLLSAAAMFFIDETYAAIAICVLIFIFLLIHYLCPPKRWGDVSQNLIYHQVRKYLLRLKPEHIKFWRPHIILLINDPRRQTRLIQFCNSMKKGSLYILGHVIVTDDFNTGVHEARLQQQAWTRYISEFSRIKAFVQLTMSPSIIWGVRNLVLSAGIGGMRPNIAVFGSYNMEDLRKSNPSLPIPDVPASPASKMKRRPKQQDGTVKRRRGDTSARLLEGVLPTDAIRTEGMMSPTDYMVMLEDLALRYKLNVAVAHGFDTLETPRHDDANTKRYIDLWPIQMSAEVSADGQNLVTTNFDTYTLILQLGHILHSVNAWRKAFAVRVMVFVEYEHEVAEESARVKALLEKLRIDANVLVFCLASGNLNMYELIVHGIANDIDTEIVVGEALKDEGWWEDLQAFRRQAEDLSASQELSQLAHFRDSTGGGYNPHEDPGNDRRRQSMAEVSEMPRKPDIATLSKLGVSMGIHTTHINDGVFLDHESDTDLDSDIDHASEDEGYEPDSDPFLTTDVTCPDPARLPLLLPQSEHAGRGIDTATTKTPSSARSGAGRKPKSIDTSLTAPSYGTMSTSETLTPTTKPETPAALHVPEVAEIRASPPGQPEIGSSTAKNEAFPVLDPLQVPEFPSNGSGRARSTSPSRSGILAPRDGGGGGGTTTPARPNFSRQSSAVRFSSRPVPETTITAEDDGSKISFAPSASNPPTPRVERPAFSRQSSLGKFSSRPLPETTVSGEEGSRTISFANPPPIQSHSGSHSRHHSRQNSQYSTLGHDANASMIPEHAEHYRDHGPHDGTESGSGSVFSSPGTALSFNDLPSRAQHLILNELMRQHSKETAVLMTTLPIPSDGTSSDEVSTIQYLSDVELLCNDLPPTLMVLSNSMTVTVSL
ncbi:hypothetical protein QQS21_011257 [Conoideocrella luteorostrata]|uniref:Amino acid permease-domain-containing protein n=1 Tax=Conoideocrella luteorostrata TaxID=1105319 RepID=A0AAJ0CDP2_9HYPO|nr:hypothetical protein QQS21_011257 [Conoideocrella luteorostrata]